MTKFIKNKLVALVLGVMVMALGVVAPSFTNTAQAAAATTKTVYVDVERNIIGQALLKEPIAVTLDDTNTILDATVQAVDASNIDIENTSLGNYAAAFKDTSNTQTAFANNYPFYNDVNTATNGVVFRTNLPNQPIITDASWLKEKEYDGISGWMFTVDNNTHNDDYSIYYTGDTKLANIPDNAVIRWEFSAAMGADLGLADSAYLPTAVTSDGYYDWNTAVYTAPFFTRADKSTLISKMANHADKTDTAYTNALNVLQTLEATQTQVNTAAAAL
jgi:hypothetical protein